MLFQPHMTVFLCYTMKVEGTRDSQIKQQQNNFWNTWYVSVSEAKFSYLI